MQLLRRYADFGAESELSAVGKRRRQVGVDASGVDFASKAFARLGRLGNDTFAVFRRIGGDVFERGIHTIDGHDTHLVVEIFVPEVAVVGALKQLIFALGSFVGLRVGKDFDTAFEHGSQ